MTISYQSHIAKVLSAPGTNMSLKKYAVLRSQNIIDINVWKFAFLVQALFSHNSDVKMGVMASQINSFTTVYSTVYSGVDQRKHQSFASLAFARGIHRWPVNSPHKWPVTRNLNVPIWWRHHDTSIRRMRDLDINIMVFALRWIRHLIFTSRYSTLSNKAWCEMRIKNQLSLCIAEI